jgi:hypothetical protein
MILPSQCMILYSSIIVSLYLMICRISMQNCIHDLFNTIFSRYTCYDTVSTYDTTLLSLIINYGDTSVFCMHGMHDTSYDTTIVTSLNDDLTRTLVVQLDDLSLFVITMGIN